MNYKPSKFNYSLLDNGACALSDRFCVPAYILGKESDMEKLYATVIAFFTSDTEVKS